MYTLSIRVSSSWSVGIDQDGAGKRSNGGTSTKLLFCAFNYFYFARESVLSKLLRSLGATTDWALLIRLVAELFGVLDSLTYPLVGELIKGSSFESSSDFVKDFISSAMPFYCLSNLSPLGNFASSSSFDEPLTPPSLLFSMLYGDYTRQSAKIRSYASSRNVIEQKL